MKKRSRIFISNLVFAAAIVSAVFTRVMARSIAYVQEDETKCVLADKPFDCLPSPGGVICTFMGVTYFQVNSEDKTLCIYPFYHHEP